MDKQGFYEEAKKFFDEGIIYEIYSTDDFCICNVADTSYAAFIYKKSNIGFTGLLLSSSGVKKIVKDNSYLGKLVNSMDDEFFRKMLIALDDKTLDFLRKVKNERKIDRDNPKIDYSMEQELINMMNKKKGGR